MWNCRQESDFYLILDPWITLIRFDKSRAWLCKVGSHEYHWIWNEKKQVKLPGHQTTYRSPDDQFILSHAGPVSTILSTTGQITDTERSHRPIMTYFYLGSWKIIVDGLHGSFNQHLLSNERADWPKLHDIFKARDAKTWKREFPVWFPFKVCASNLLSINISSPCCCYYRKRG